MFSLRHRSDGGDLKMFLVWLMVQFERGELTELRSQIVNKS